MAVNRYPGACYICRGRSFIRGLATTLGEIEGNRTVAMFEFMQTEKEAQA